MSEQNDTKKNISSKTKDITTPVRMKKHTAKYLQSIAAKLNKKQFGRKITPDDIVSKALDLLHDNKTFLDEIQNHCLTNADKIEIRYREYCNQNGKISKDDFLGLLLQN